MNSTAAEPAVSVPDISCSAERDKGSYGQILKSSALIGGSQVASIAIRIVRTKAMAMLLGPSGIGLFGLYGSVEDLTYSIAGMGINASGVRQIAEAAGSADQQRIGRTAAVLRRTSVVLGLFGALLLLGFARPISSITFTNADHVAGVSLLSLSVLFRLISGGQSALIQGMRRISDLAKMNVLGPVFGTCVTIPIVYFFRARGVVPSLVAASAMMIITSWWYSRKIDVPICKVTRSEVQHEASALLKLGSAFMASGLMMMGVAYVVRVIITRKIGLEATGLYQAAWTLGGLYVGFILQAMSADFYPRLTANIHNHCDCNRLVNEQTLVGILLAGPGVLATITFTPLVVALFYSAQFSAAVPVVRWICMGIMLQVITWPMGFIIVAKGNQLLFFLAELAYTIVAIAFAWAGVAYLGLTGAGVAFFGSYMFHAILIYPIVRRQTGFSWSATAVRTGSLFFFLVGVALTACYILPLTLAVSVGILITTVGSVYSTKTLLSIVPSSKLPELLRIVRYRNRQSDSE